ncbi:MAG TPA: hypothetical protein VGJ26_19400 [Pirellulales bacterium]
MVAQTSLVSAQQYNRGIVLDPRQTGNIDRIFQQERDEAQRMNSRPSVDAEPEQFSWNQRATRAFRAGNYAVADNNWRHALVDEPQDGIFTLRLAQTQFALANYGDAAGSIQKAMTLLPYEYWGVVVKNYKDLYPNNLAFTTQLRALEKARKENPLDPAPRFLLGYQYLYLGFPKQAEIELQKAVELDPENEFSKKLAAVASAAAIATANSANSKEGSPAKTPAEDKPALAGGDSVPSKPPSLPPQRPKINPPD